MRFTTSLFLLSTLGAFCPLAAGATINIDGRLADSNEASDLEWGDNSLLANDAAIPSPVADDDGTVTLSVATNGQLWNDSWSDGAYDAGEEWNIKQANETGASTATTAQEAIDGGRFLSFTLSSNLLTPIDWESVSASLWRNGPGAPNTFQLAIDDGDGFDDVGDLVGSATVAGQGTANAVTISFSGAAMPTNVTSGEVRLYYWDTDSNTSTSGNFHLYDVVADYSVVPEPATAMLSLVAAVGVILLARRQF